MKTLSFLAAAIGILLGNPTAQGMATSRVGPDSAHPHPTVEQTDWPKGIVALPRHESRVYSVWVNGNENFYFQADLKEINELIHLFSEARMRDHKVVIKKGQPKVSSFKKEEYAYNVNLHVLAGIALGYVRGKNMKEAETHEPQLIIHLTEKEAAAWLDKLVIPENLILTSEFDGLKSPRKRPTRKNWFTEVRFEDGKPAVDFQNNLQTRVTMWDHTSKQGIYLGGVGYKGDFHTPFSDEEMKKLKSGDIWLTLTTGNWSTALKPDHPRLNPADLHPDREQVKPIRIKRPGYLHGRILFDDGAPPVLDPEPWPGAKIRVNFAYAGAVSPDADGYFKIFFTPKQLEQLKARKTRRNIYIPLEQKGRSRALYAFPADRLSPSKDKAGVVKIPRPSTR